MSSSSSSQAGIAYIPNPYDMSVREVVTLFSRYTLLLLKRIKNEAKSFDAIKYTPDDSILIREPPVSPEEYSRVSTLEAWASMFTGITFMCDNIISNSINEEDINDLTQSLLYRCTQILASSDQALNSHNLLALSRTPECREAFKKFNDPRIRSYIHGSALLPTVSQCFDKLQMRSLSVGLDSLKLANAITSVKEHKITRQNDLLKRRLPIKLQPAGFVMPIYQQRAKGALGLDQDSAVGEAVGVKSNSLGMTRRQALPLPQPTSAFMSKEEALEILEYTPEFLAKDRTTGMIELTQRFKKLFTLAMANKSDTTTLKRAFNILMKHFKDKLKGGKRRTMKVKKNFKKTKKTRVRRNNKSKRVIKGGKR